VAHELQTLEYGQRIAHETRAVHSQTGSPVGELLYGSALAGGAASIGQPVGALDAGVRADLVYFEPDAPGLVGHSPATLLDAWLVAGSSAVPDRVMVGGRWIVRDGTHPHEAEIGRHFRSTMNRIRNRV
jgi:formimidoylglutamate deiminase